MPHTQAISFALTDHYNNFVCVCVCVAQQQYSGLGRLIIEVARSHSDTTHTEGPLWTIDMPVEEGPLPDNTQHLQETDIHAPGGIRTRNPSK